MIKMVQQVLVFCSNPQAFATFFKKIIIWTSVSIWYHCTTLNSHRICCFLFSLLFQYSWDKNTVVWQTKTSQIILLSYWFWGHHRRCCGRHGWSVGQDYSWAACTQHLSLHSHHPPHPRSQAWCSPVWQHKDMRNRSLLLLTIFIPIKYRGINLSGPSNFQCSGRKTGAPTKLTGERNLVFITFKFCVNVANVCFSCSKTKKCTMIKSFATEIISTNWRKKAPDVIHDKHSHWRDVDRWIWWSVNRSKPSSVDSLSSSDRFSHAVLGR